MQCPVDGAQLIMTDRSGVEIDYCPTCRGVWLDRGELDKIIERSAPAAPAAADPPRARGGDDFGRDRDRDRDRRDSREYRGKKKKSSAASLLGEIFDF